MNAELTPSYLPLENREGNGETIQFILGIATVAKSDLAMTTGILTQNSELIIQNYFICF